ncbi:hypothetical protein C8Q79DRAFT_5937 [Trametes meyenii]|nr:hypothetical protein C8Q79DRAFT_5937 [Trametes meyenii]
MLVPFTHFPPPSVFGTSVTKLVLKWSTNNWAENDPSALQEYMASLQLLERLHLEICPYDYRYIVEDGGAQVFSDWLAFVITSIGGHMSLRTICLRFWPPGTWWKQSQSPVNRYLCPTTIMSPAFGKAICGLPALRELAFVIPFCPSELPYKANRWANVVRERLVSLRAGVLVHVRGELVRLSHDGAGHAHRSFHPQISKVSLGLRKIACDPGRCIVLASRRHDHTSSRDVSSVSYK